MAEPIDLSAASELLRIARGHPEFVEGEALADGSVRLSLKVEMPLHLKVNGISETGVRTVETVFLTLPATYPWQSPRVAFRDDFPRGFPHLLPTAPDKPPQPCLVDGDQDEFFLQWGLVEYGIFHLVEQIAVWLRKAAVGALIDPNQGWEPMMRRDLVDGLDLDGEAARASVTKAGGSVAWHTRFIRHGEVESRLLAGASTWLTSDGKVVPLSNKAKDKQFTTSTFKDEFAFGHTVIGLTWPDKLPSGAAFVSDVYMPETVTTLGSLRQRARDFGCERGLEQFLKNLERSFTGFALEAPIPVGVVLCVRRPVHLIGSKSPIELLPYVIEIRALENRTSLFPKGDDEPVAPAAHYQSMSTALFRSLSSTPERPAIALLGCGSVGSKIAVHAARAGQAILAVSDKGFIRPHNMARHALGGRHIGKRKADALADELLELNQRPQIHDGDLAQDLHAAEKRKLIIPWEAKAVLNATASLAVREALVASTVPTDKARQIEAALFGRGRMGYLLVEGKRHNPNHSDLMAELYATLADEEGASLLSDPHEGLAEVQIGQGCGSLTMTVEDAQLSMMSAALATEIGRTLDAPVEEGQIVIGISDSDSPATRWTKLSVLPFETVPIEGSNGWQLRCPPSAPMAQI